MKAKWKRILRRAGQLLRFSLLLVAMGCKRLAEVCKPALRKVGQACGHGARRAFGGLRVLLKSAGAATVRFFSRIKEHVSNGVEEKKRQANTPLVDPMAALIPTRDDEQATQRSFPRTLQEILNSSARFSRHVRMLWVRRGMLACVIAVVLCLALLGLLSAAKIKSIEVTGNQYYSEEEIRSLAGLEVGEGRYSFSPDDVEKRLLEGLPYLSEVTVKVGGGKVEISLQEHDARWALVAKDGSFALLNDELSVLQICSAEELPQGACLLYAELAPITGENDQGETVTLTQQLKVGKQVVLGTDEQTVLTELSAALRSVELPFGVKVLDLTRPYFVVLSLWEDTDLYLYRCTEAQRRLQMAAAALHAYLTANGQEKSGTLRVDVNDQFMVSIRPEAKKSQ